MKKGIFCLFGIILTAMLPMCADDKGSGGNMFTDALKKTALTVTPGFKALLVENKHTTERAAPVEFQALIEALLPSRFELSAGFVVKQDALEFIWYMNEIAFNGTPDEVLNQVAKKMTASGFNAETVEEEHIYKKTGKDFNTVFTMEGPRRYVGGKAPACGARFSWSVIYPKGFSPPLLKEVITAYPQISCPELDSDIAGMLAGKPVQAVFYGGTWSNYYTFDCDIPYADKSGRDADFMLLKELLDKKGFIVERDENGLLTYKMQNATEPYVFVDISAAKTLSVRIQPHT